MSWFVLLELVFTVMPVIFFKSVKFSTFNPEYAAGTDDLTSEDMEHPTQSSQVELARLMFWLMVVGYNLRTLEVRFDMEQTMLLPPGV